MKEKRKRSVFWLLVALEGAISTGLIFLTPSEGKNALIFGLSKLRLLMCIGLAGLSALCLLASARAFRSENEKEIKGLNPFIGRIALICLYLLCLGAFLLSPPIGTTAFAIAMRERLTPMALWGALFVCQTFIFAALETPKAAFSRLFRFLLFPGGLILISAGVLRFAISSGTGLRAISGAFYRQGVSILEGQLLASLFGTGALLLLFFFISPKLSEQTRRKAEKFSRPMLFVAIWASAAIVWSAVPFEGRSYFLPALRPPNYNFYPASDAENYDLLAQSILIGNGFRNGMTVVRPLYIAFLSLLHLLAGNDYMDVTGLQIIVMGLFPAILFLIGAKIQRPASGVLIAALAILREVNSLKATPLVQVSNVRLLMSDMPTTLIISLITLSFINWLNAIRHKDRRQTLTHSLICGGLIGVGMLVRTQVFILIPAVLASAMIPSWFTWAGFKREQVGAGLRIVLMQSALLFLGCLCAFGPWTLWNEMRPNETVSEERSEAHYLLRLYQQAAGGAGAPASETDLPAIILKYPQSIFQAVSAHFINNELSTLLVLPVREKAVKKDAAAWFNDQSLFWYRESARDVLEKRKPLIVLYLTLICLGIGFCFRKAGWAGAAPLIIHLSYSAGSALAMNSGFRFILPADWAGFFYFATGFCGLAQSLIALLGQSDQPFSARKSAPIDDERNAKSQPRALVATASIFLLIGLTLPICDGLIPYRYDETLTPAALFARWRDLSPENQSFAKAEKIQEKVSDGRLVILQGRAIYPRYYPPNEGDSGGLNNAKTGLPFGRTVWTLTNRVVTTISLPTSPPAHDEIIPDPLDAIVIGAYRDGYFDALALNEYRSDSVVEQ